MNNNSTRRTASRTGAGETAAPAGDGEPRRDGSSGFAGVAIIKSVSLFIANGRRASRSGQTGRRTRGNMTMDGSTGNAPRRRRSQAMEDTASGKINPKLLDMYKKKTQFSRVEIEALVRIYRKLVSKVTSKAATTGIAKPHSTVEGIDRGVFRELLHTTFDIVTEEMLMERIFCAWEKGFEGLPIRLEGWIMGLNTFLRGSQEEKMAYCFRVYDLNGDGFITKDEIFALLRNCLVKQPQDEDPDEGVKDLVEIALKKLDYDKDGKLSFNDFQSAVTDEPLLLEAFGQCLPSESATVSFLSTLQA